MTVMAPSDENECRQMLYTAFQMDTPTAVRYPRGIGTGVVPQKEMQMLPVGRGEIRRNGSGIALLAFGSMLKPCLEVGDELDATVVNMRFVKPMDDELIASVAQNHQLLVTVEENTIMGGAGSAVLESLANRGITTPILQLGLPDVFIDQGDPSQMLADCGLDKTGILRSVRTRLTQQAA
jgi:1-deoxy-D-xylulose-5-phosphate synthase